MRIYGFDRHRTGFDDNGTVMVADEADQHKSTPIFAQLAREFNAQIGAISIAEKPQWLICSTELVPATTG